MILAAATTFSKILAIVCAYAIGVYLTGHFMCRNMRKKIQRDRYGVSSHSATTDICLASVLWPVIVPLYFTGKGIYLGISGLMKISNLPNLYDFLVTLTHKRIESNQKSGKSRRQLMLPPLLSGIVQCACVGGLWYLSHLLYLSTWHTDVAFGALLYGIGSVVFWKCACGGRYDWLASDHVWIAATWPFMTSMIAFFYCLIVPLHAVGESVSKQIRTSVWGKNE